MTTVRYEKPSWLNFQGLPTQRQLENWADETRRVDEFNAKEYQRQKDFKQQFLKDTAKAFGANSKAYRSIQRETIPAPVHYQPKWERWASRKRTEIDQHNRLLERRERARLKREEQAKRAKEHGQAMIAGKRQAAEARAQLDAVAARDLADLAALDGLTLEMLYAFVPDELDYYKEDES